MTLLATALAALTLSTSPATVPAMSVSVQPQGRITPGTAVHVVVSVQHETTCALSTAGASKTVRVAGDDRATFTFRADAFGMVELVEVQCAPIGYVLAPISFDKEVTSFPKSPVITVSVHHAAKHAVVKTKKPVKTTTPSKTSAPSTTKPSTPVKTTTPSTGKPSTSPATKPPTTTPKPPTTTPPAPATPPTTSTPPTTAPQPPSGAIYQQPTDPSQSGGSTQPTMTPQQQAQADALAWWAANGQNVLAGIESTGVCATWAAEKRPDIIAQLWEADYAAVELGESEPLLSGGGGAAGWLAAAKLAPGLTVSSVPKVGALVLFQAGSEDSGAPSGHVAYVESMNGSTFTLSEMNVGGVAFAMGTRTFPSAPAVGVTFIY